MSKKRAFGALSFLLICGAMSSATYASCLAGGFALETGELLEVVPHPTEADTLFVLQSTVALDGLALLKSCDNGATWSATALTSDFYIVTSLAIDPTNSNIAYAMTNRGALVSSDGGTNWSESDLPFGDLIFGSDGTLYSFDEATINKRSPGQAWATTTPVPSGFEELRPHPTDASILHVGQFYSVDGGASWQQVLSQRIDDIRYSLSDPMKMIATSTPALLSNDGGVNWSELPLEEFEVFNTVVADGKFVAFDAEDSETIWVATEFCGLWRSDTGGARWRLPMDGLTGDPASCWLGDDRPDIKRFESSPVDANRFYAITSDGLFVTIDDGESWTSANGGAGNPEPPPPNPYSGDADLALDLFGLPGTFTPPVTLQFSGRITHNGPDIAREVTFSIPATSITTSHGSCDGGSCDFGDVAAGTVIQLTLQREILGGGIGAQCNGDVFQISGRVTATTNDPNPSNNSDTVSTTRQNSGSLISRCDGEGLLQQEGGGGSTDWHFVLVLLFFAFLRSAFYELRTTIRVIRL